MSDFQIFIVGGRPIGQAGVNADTFSVEQHSRGGERAIQSIEALGEVWDQVVAKLAGLAAKSRDVVKSSPYDLAEIEFSIGIEAGLSVGLVTKGDASVSLKFTKKDQIEIPESGAQ